MSITISSYNPNTAQGTGPAYPAVHPTPELREWINRNINTSDFNLWSYRAFPGLGLAATTWPTGFKPSDDVVIDRFRYFRPASRWNFIHLLMDGATLNAVNSFTFGNDGSSYFQILLSISAPPVSNVGPPQFEQINTPMWMLPPIPLSAFTPGTPQPYPGAGLQSGIPLNNGTTGNMYLITLVDDRYFWWNVPWKPFSAPIADTTTWQNMLDQVNLSLKVYGFAAVTTDPVAVAYLNASPAFQLPYESVAPIVDMIAVNTGMRFVRKWNGSCVIQSSKSAQAQIAADFNANPGRTLRAGGDSFPVALPYQ